jgi:phospholipase/lecithinase/hemolysin
VKPLPLFVLLSLAVAAACDGGSETAHPRDTSSPYVDPSDPGAKPPSPDGADAADIARGLVPDVNGNGIGDGNESWQALPYDVAGVFVFGDSLSDTGNMFRRYGVPPSPPNYQGRYSNGPVWIEYLTKWIGVDSNHVHNFAHGGAQTGHGNASIPGAPGLLDQVATFLGSPPRFSPDEEPLFVLWIGPNDFATATNLVTTVGDAMTNIEQAVTGLAVSGARRFLVLNSPDLAKTPRVRDTGDPALAERARIASIAFNSNLAWKLANLEQSLGIDVLYQDFFTHFEAIAADPQAFGFTSATQRCLLSNQSPPCANPDQHVFWDDLHPTAAGHREIARQSITTLLTGGDALPRPGTPMPAGAILLASPLHGTFASQDQVTVTGSVFAPGQGPATVLVNGQAAVVDANGNFTATVTLPPGEPQHAIVASLTSGGHVVDRDRVIVFRGDSIGSGQTDANAVAASLTLPGIQDLEDTLLHELQQNNLLNIRNFITSANPIASNFTGTLQYVVDAVDAGYRLATLDLVPQSGRVHVRINLHDAFVDWNAHAWLQGLPDPGFDCAGRVSAGSFSLFTDLSFSPGAMPGEVRVVQMSPLRYEMVGFGSEYSCDPIVELAQAVTGIQVNMRQRIESGLSSVLEGSQDVLPAFLERALAEVSVSRAVGGALGVPVTGNLRSIAIGPDLVTLNADLAIGSGLGGQRTLALPHGQAPHAPTEPVGNRPYDLVASVSLTTINQVLLSQANVVAPAQSIRELDLGSGPVPLTAGVFAALVPEMGQLNPATGLELRLQPTLAPRLLGAPSGLASGQIGRLSIPQLLVDLVPTTGTNRAPLVSVSLDVLGDLELGFAPASSMLTIALRGGTGSALVVENPLGVQEASLVAIVETLAARFVSGAGLARFTLPRIADVDFTVAQVVAQAGFASLYLHAAAPVRQPDLVVSELQVPAAVDRNFPFNVPVSVRNQGARDSFGSGFEVKAFLSLDGALDPLDPLVGSAWFPAGALPPGSQWHGHVTIQPMPWAVPTNQRLFFYADCPLLPGSAGLVFERDERNNIAGAPILTTDPDAQIESIQAPTNLVGGVGPRSWRVRVRRDSVGIDVLQVPVRVEIGNPTLTWAQILVGVPRGQAIDVDIDVPTPASFGQPGQSNTFQVRAGANLVVDSNRSNDVRTTTAQVAVPFWDVAFSIQGPSSVRRGTSTLSWTVNVRNLGNVPSNNVCALTCLGLYPQSRNYASSFPARFFSTGVLAPGQSRDITISNYAVPSGAFLGTQYLKAEVNYAAPLPTHPNHCHGSDLVNPGNNNYAVRPITVLP